MPRRLHSAACPAPVPNSARCYTGRDGAGAFYWIAIPHDWNRVLIMHAYGGPETGPSLSERSRKDLERWAATVKAGYARAGSTYRRGGYGVTMAAEDTERLRRLFIAHFGAPRRTLPHGQSYGGAVASKAAELYSVVSGRPGPYDGVLLTNGVLGGAATAPTSSGWTCAWSTGTSAATIRGPRNRSTRCGWACQGIRR